MNNSFEFGRLAEEYRQQGFTCLPDLLSKTHCTRMLEAFEQLSQGIYETRTYPDQWMRDPPDSDKAILFISNAWKANNTVASLVLSKQLGEIVAKITGWDSVRLAMDSMLCKPPSGNKVNFHQDSAYMRCFSPDDSVTVWIPLDDIEKNMGSLEYCAGSHLWSVGQDLAKSGVPQSYRSNVINAALQVGIDSPEFKEVTVNAGTAMVHHGSVWHGSGVNQVNRPRRSIAIHFVKGLTEFNDCEQGFIFKRYQMFGSNALNEAAFPITYSDKGYRTELKQMKASLFD